MDGWDLYVKNEAQQLQQRRLLRDAANEAQKALVESRGGPEQGMANLVTSKGYTPVPTGMS